MNKGISYLLLVCIVCFMLFPLEVRAEKGLNEEKKTLSLMSEALLKMDKFYYEEIPKERVSNLFYRSQIMQINLMRNLELDYDVRLKKMTYSLLTLLVKTLRDDADTFSKFIYKDYLKRTMREQVKSSFKSIGIEIEKRDELFFVSNVYDDSSAREHGIVKQDQLLSVNGQHIMGWDLKVVEKIFKLKDGDTVELTLVHSGDNVPYTVILESKVITIPTVEAMFDKKAGVGSILIRKFRNDTGQEVREALQSFPRSNLKGVVIDVRNNSGGDETQAVAVASFFMPSGTSIVTFRKRGEAPDNELTDASPLFPDIPLIIIVNKQSTSASEILAGAMQHYKRALVVGEKTGGKGSLKNLFSLRDGSALFLVTSKSFMPNGETFDEVGIQPDVVINDVKLQKQVAITMAQGKV